MSSAALDEFVDVLKSMRIMHVNTGQVQISVSGGSSMLYDDGIILKLIVGAANSIAAYASYKHSIPVAMRPTIAQYIVLANAETSSSVYVRGRATR
ncbi:hypothetical protein EON67_10215 [archaeon]|nr:MAG: hypothetical protein EON67_10215 [archaeon]